MILGRSVLDGCSLIGMAANRARRRFTDTRIVFWLVRVPALTANSEPIEELAAGHDLRPALYEWASPDGSRELVLRFNSSSCSKSLLLGLRL